jgi:bifunctional polynucleotide phosphatase/kinase
MIFNIYKKKYVEPSTKEGFSEIVKVNFVPKFKSKDEEKLYKMYLLEK